MSARKRTLALARLRSAKLQRLEECHYFDGFYMLQFYNTLTKKKEPFEPLEPGVVRMYNCGPTVYSEPHIGNFRAFVFADLLRRYLEYKGFKVNQVMNITDVGHLLEDRDDGEDRIEIAAKREKKTHGRSRSITRTPSSLLWTSSALSGQACTPARPSTSPR